jgi:hypothetical protein
MSAFWIIFPCSPLKVNRHFGGTSRLQRLLATCFTLASCLTYFSTLKMEATCSSETSVDFQDVHGVISQKIELFLTAALEYLKSYTSCLLVYCTPSYNVHTFPLISRTKNKDFPTRIMSPPSPVFVTDLTRTEFKFVGFYFSTGNT